MDQEILGKLESQELKEGGKDIQVTEENKEEYIRYVAIQLVGCGFSQSTQFAATSAHGYTILLVD